MRLKREPVVGLFQACQAQDFYLTKDSDVRLLYNIWAQTAVLFSYSTSVVVFTLQFAYSISLFSPTLLSAKQPPTPSVPVIVSEVTGNTVYLKCSFASSSNSSLGYVVAWSRLSPEGRKEELKQETTIQTSAFIELDGFNLRLGDKVWWGSCSGITWSLF